MIRVGERTYQGTYQQGLLLARPDRGWMAVAVSEIGPCSAGGSPRDRGLGFVPQAGDVAQGVDHRRAEVRVKVQRVLQGMPRPVRDVVSDGRHGVHDPLEFIAIVPPAGRGEGVGS
jgi:hypothetical protein